MGKGGEGQTVFYNLLAGLNLLTFAAPDSCSARLPCTLAISTASRRTGPAAAAVPLAALSAAPFFAAASPKLYLEDAVYNGTLLRITETVRAPEVKLLAPDSAVPGGTVSLSVSIKGCATSLELCSPLTEDSRVILYVVDQAWLNLGPPRNINVDSPLKLTRDRSFQSSVFVSTGSTIENLVSVERVRAWPQVRRRRRHELCRRRCRCILLATFFVPL